MTLNLDEMLIYADIEQINKIADNYQCQCNRHSKTEMIQSIIYTLYKKEMINRYIKGLESVEISFMQLLFFDSRLRLTIEDLLAKAKQAASIHNSEIKPKQLVLLALKRGWIFQGVGKKNLLVYLVPIDLKRKIIKSIKQHIEESLISVNEVDFYRDEQNLIVSDLSIFLTYIQKEEVLLTGTGAMYRRNQQDLFQFLLITEQVINKQLWRFGFGRKYNEYPDRFSLIYDYAYYRNYIKEENGYLNITNEGKYWLENAERDKESLKMFKFWIRLYKHAIPYLPLIVKFIDLVAYKKWIELKTFKNGIVVWLNDHYYENKDIVFMERIIKMLLHLGIIQISFNDDITFIRITEDGHQFINGFESFNAKDIVL